MLNVNEIMAIAEGNLGALQFVMECLKSGNNQLVFGLSRVVICGISGEKLYMLWNDCCGRDNAKTEKVMMEASMKEIHEHINYENGRGIPFDGEEWEGKQE